MQDVKKKRFIAGASCPHCAEVDKIYTFERGNKKWRACAACDFEEEFSESIQASSQQELVTRVNQSRIGEPVLAHETPVEAVKLIDSTDRKNNRG